MGAFESEKKQQEDEIKHALFKPPDLFAVEVKELEEATEALEHATVRIPTSGAREVGDHSFGDRLGVGPDDDGPKAQNAPGLSIADLFDHSYSPPPPPQDQMLALDPQS